VKLKTLTTVNENGPVAVEARSANGHDLVEELVDCNQRLGICIEKGDWDKAAQEVDKRNKLLSDLPSALNKLERECSTEELLAGKRRIRWMLEDLQATNERFLKSLNGSISSQRKRIKEIKKGRRMLGLYRRPHPEHPRFLNRFG